MAGPLLRHGLTECEQTELLNQVLYDNRIIEYTSDDSKSKKLTHKISDRKMVTDSQNGHSADFSSRIKKCEDMTVDAIYVVLHCSCEMEYYRNPHKGPITAITAFCTLLSSPKLFPLKK